MSIGYVPAAIKSALAIERRQYLEKHMSNEGASFAVPEAFASNPLPPAQVAELTVRDYFAATALQAMIASGKVSAQTPVIGLIAYKIADEMLSARSVPKPGTDLLAARSGYGAADAMPDASNAQKVGDSMVAKSNAQKVADAMLAASNTRKVANDMLASSSLK